MSNQATESGIQKFIIFSCYFLFAVHITMNLLGMQALRFFYLFEVIFVLFAVFLTEPKKSLLPLILLFFIEGQGRIIWSYHPVMRNIFDIALALCVLKSISLRKTLMPTRALPYGVVFIIGFHFFWYAIQLFNVDSVGIVTVLLTSKIYIFPFFVFFLYLNNPLELEDLRRIQSFVFFVIIGECILSIYQMNNIENSVLVLSPYYERSLRNIFVGVSFRPYGTSFAPGAFSVYFFLSLGFLFLISFKSSLKRIMMPIVLASTWFCLFIMQVRSAFIKHILISFALTFGIFLYSKYKFKHTFKFILLGIAVVLVLGRLPNLDKLFPEIDFQTSIDRIEQLRYSEGKGHRASADTALNVIIQKLSQNPMGLGPGRTGAAASMGADFIYKDPLYGIASSWAYDNLIISLVIDLGVGAIFYILAIAILWLKLFQGTIMAYKSDNYYRYRLSLVSCVTCFVILVGNWGAVGLPYNPESFIFWFFMALGLNTQYQGRLDDQQH